jgi:hypothetical protein
MTIDFEIIEKENIGTLKFPHSEVRGRYCN